MARHPLRPPNLHLVRLREQVVTDAAIPTTAPAPAPEIPSNYAATALTTTTSLNEWDLNLDFGKRVGLGSGLAVGYTFLSSLHQSLTIDHYTSSPMSTPHLYASSTALPPPSPLSQSATLTPPSSSSSSSSSLSASGPDNDSPSATIATPDLSSLPELRTYITTSSDEKIAALKLLADSIAQQRQTASIAVIHHPLTLLSLLPLLLLYTISPISLSTTLLTTASFFTTILLTARYLSTPYLSQAERIGWAWLGDSEVMVTRFGDDIIGTLVFDEVRGAGGKKKRKGREGVCKGWTVRRRERGRGVGRALLEEGVRVLVGERGCEGVGWEIGHAHSERVLPTMFNQNFEKREENARRLLEQVIRAQLALGKKRK